MKLSEVHAGHVGVQLQAAVVDCLGRDGLARRVLGPVDLCIEPGETVALVGPSAAGKSTLLRLVANLVKASDGQVRVSCADGPVRIGFAPQDPALLPWLSVIENVLLPARLGAHAAPDAATIARALAILDGFGLAGMEAAFPAMLSGGMQSRVALARALVVQPNLLLLDEPFGSLDEVTAERIMVDLEQMRAGCTTLLVSHNIEQATFLADRVLVLSASPGRLVGDVRVDGPHPRGPSFLAGPIARSAATGARARLRATTP